MTANPLMAVAVMSLICLISTQAVWGYDVELEWNSNFGRRSSVFYGRIVNVDEQVLVGGSKVLVDGDLLWIGQFNDQMNDFEWEVEYGDSLHDGSFGQLCFYNGSLVAVTNQVLVEDRDIRSLHINYLDLNGDSLDWFDVPLEGNGGPGSRGAFINEDGSLDMFVTSADDGEYDPFAMFRINEDQEVVFERHYNGEEDFGDGRQNNLTSVISLCGGGYIITGRYYFDRWYGDLRRFCAPASVIKLSEDGEVDWIFLDADSVLDREPDIYRFNSRGDMNIAFEHSSGAVYTSGCTGLWTDHEAEEYGLYVTLYKFDPDGALLWRRIYNDNWSVGPNSSYFNHIVELRPDRLALFGHIRYRMNDERESGVYAALMDTTGEILADSFIRGEGIFDDSDDFLTVTKIDSNRVLAILRQGDRILSIRFDLDPEDHIVAEEPFAPATLSLSAHPNPFNSAVSIDYELNLSAEVSLSVIDLAGREVARLHEGKLSAGNYTATWNAANVPSGVYFARLTAGGTVKTAKVVCLR